MAEASLSASSNNHSGLESDSSSSDGERFSSSFEEAIVQDPLEEKDHLAMKNFDQDSCLYLESLSFLRAKYVILSNYEMIIPKLGIRLFSTSVNFLCVEFDALKVGRYFPIHLLIISPS